ncbi:transporter substrate-binding domain-containing protein [Campylobacter sp. JMF_01 NE2]|uniref:transporter substrate-binding domain-containing protein n=1 Tax=unclassified Campylobacter TaxID=2593542 RepID=UPI0022E9E770|nr:MULTISPECIES: transporter substrate-binding domain-containing protein [unclassified Campylobacter]MDA3057669.1 transporter substrate-binding domain-containing protein [Campylobacter sp. VBCF_04 NA7]MDA3058570.1 transporter substrate-binding domain-containing protein [Campylobacter sp. VBCF_05 NA6]MDA3062518.1 transporter substrate-binding domain-containing protein [Campylobacter sp. JMF_14 EL1]MDA3066875.1 transporter substrate-binding domain-containing protein [Campylobacter sp. JMF_01 NE2]
MKKFLGLLALAGAVTFSGANTLEQIKASNTLRIGVGEHDAPMSSISKSGKFQGFEIELAKELAKAILGDGGKVEFVAVKDAERMDAVTQNRVDLLIHNYSRTPEREKSMDFSMPYLSTMDAVVTKKDLGVQRLSDLRGRRVLVVPGTSAEVALNKEPQIQQVPCSTSKECLDKLRAGEADGYARKITAIATIPFVDDRFELAIKRIGAIAFNCVGTQKGNRDLMEIVDSKILSLSQEGFFADMYEQTFELFYRGELEEKMFVLDDIYEALL